MSVLFNMLSRLAWRRKWQPTPVFLPGESQGQRSLVGCCPWGHKESDAAARTHFLFLYSTPPCHSNYNSSFSSLLRSLHWIPNYYLSLCAQSCLTLCGPMDGSSPSSSVHGILQARALEWVAISFSRGFSQSRDWTCVSCLSCIGRWVLYWLHPLEALIMAPKNDLYCLLCLSDLSAGPGHGQLQALWGLGPPYSSLHSDDLTCYFFDQ